MSKLMRNNPSNDEVFLI